MSKYRLSLAVTIVAGFALTIFFFISGSDSTQAGPPAYWITIDESEMDHLRSESAATGKGSEFEVIERRSGLAIVKLDELGSQEISSRMHDSFHKCAGFFRHETLEQARESIDLAMNARADLQLVDYTIDNQANVTPMLSAATEPTIRQMIIDLSALHTRRHDQPGGTDGANLILNRWRAIALGRTDISVQPYAHLSPTNPDVFLTPQPSIVATVTGTEFPDEIVIVGGHQDSIRSGMTTGAAPGADDDASGIAATTEILRTIVDSGFRPKRTIQFMAYAAEEVGLVGSKNIADTYFAQNRNVVGVMQLDMVNYSGPWADIVMITDNTNAAQNQFIRDLVTAYQPTLVVKNDACGYGCSDHASWHARGYPASMPFEAKYSNTGSTREYNPALHTANDTLSRSNNNADHALKFAKLGISFVGELAKGSVAPPLAENDAAFDFDGDGKTDVSVYRPEDGIWHLNRSQDQYTAIRFGIAADRIIPADYDGDGKADIAVYRNGIWHLLRSDEGYTSFEWGLADDIPQPGDYDGDGKADAAIFRPSTGTWYIRSSSGVETIFPFGSEGDRPMAADYDGDSKVDAAVYRGGIWHILGSTQGYNSFQFGIPTDQPLTGDFDGDGKTDLSVFRDGIWYTLRSTGGFNIVQFGLAGDTPTVGDYDGDGRSDISIYRGGVWYIWKSSDSSYRIEQFGISTDTPAPSAFLN